MEKETLKRELLGEFKVSIHKIDIFGHLHNGHYARIIRRILKERDVLPDIQRKLKSDYVTFETSLIRENFTFKKEIPKGSNINYHLNVYEQDDIINIKGNLRLNKALATVVDLQLGTRPEYKGINPIIEGLYQYISTKRIEAEDAADPDDFNKDSHLFISKIKSKPALVWGKWGSEKFTGQPNFYKMKDEFSTALWVRELKVSYYGTIPPAEGFQIRTYVREERKHFYCFYQEVIFDGKVMAVLETRTVKVDF